ncbi:MAG: DUF5050 domain-containing protein [Christensenellales bacterium]
MRDKMMKMPFRAYGLITVFFAVFICLVLLAGCMTDADVLKPEATVQKITAATSQPATATPMPFYDKPEGGSRVMRYGQYIYYISGDIDPAVSRLYRMHEDGTGSEMLLPEENVSELLMAGGKLYVTGTFDTDNVAGGSNRILQRIEPGGSITELKRYDQGLLRMLDGEIYFTSYNPMEGMELAEEQERQWTDLSGSGEGFSAKWIGDYIFKTDGHLYYTYSIADVPGKKYHQVLVKELPDGTKEEILDKGQITSDLFKCGDDLVYGKGLRFPSQIWSYDIKSGNKKLLFDMNDVKNASNILNIIGAKDGWVYFRYRYKDSYYMYYRISIENPETVETVWDWYKKGGELLKLDLENGWIYYALPEKVPEEEKYMYADESGYILRSYRCRLDGSGAIKFSDRTAQNPVTIGDCIYFVSADKDLVNITIKRYNTVTGELEEIPNGYVRQVIKSAF